MSAPAPPSPLFLRYLPQLRGTGAPGLDLACGRGRHALALAATGRPTLALDRDGAALAEIAGRARAARLPLLAARTDLETRHEIPIRPGSCGVILVFRFLFRALAPAIQRALAPGGLLLYETFTDRQPTLGWGPRNPAFLLASGELPTLFPDLVVLDAWEGRSAGERPEELANLVARKPA